MRVCFLFRLKSARAHTPNDASSETAEGGATAARGGCGGGAAGVTPGAVLCSAIVRRLFALVFLRVLADVLIRKVYLIVIPINVVSLIYFHFCSDDVLQSFAVYGKYLLALNAYALGACLLEVARDIRAQKVHGDWVCNVEHDEHGNLRRIYRRKSSVEWTRDADSVWRRR